MIMFRNLRLTLVVLLLGSLTSPSFAQQGEGTGPDYETRLTALEETMRSLNGRLEQLEFNIRRIDQNLQRLQADNDQRLSKLEQAQAASAQTAALAPVPQPTAPAPVAALAPVPTAPANSATGSSPAVAAPTGPVSGTLGALKMQDGKVTGAVSNPQAPALPDAPADYGLTVQEQYDRAFDLLRKANYEDAETAFKTFIEKNPKDKLIDNAKYWYGETLYVRGRYSDSAVAFADAYQQNPRGTKAPDSLLKLALSLSNLDKIPDACATLAELKGKYPNASTNVRSLADQQRAKLKCGAT